MKISLGPLKLEFKTLAELATELPREWGNNAAKEFGKAAGDKIGEHVGAKLAENVPAASNVGNTVEEFSDVVYGQVEKAMRHPLNPWAPFINRFLPPKPKAPAP